MGKRRVNFQRCWLPVSRIGLHRRGVERVNCGPKLLDLGEKGVYSSYTLSAAGQKEYVHAHRGETGCERGFKHIARQARILADHDTMAVVTATKDTASRHADAQGGFRRHRAFVGFATNTVCAEIFAHHKVDYPVVGSPSKGTCLLNREYREISRMCS